MNHPRIRNLPLEERDAFLAWLAGRTCPVLVGLPETDQDAFYPWDYREWRASLGYVPLASCEAGTVYHLRSRNLVAGAYDGKEGFIGIREKFGAHYLFTEYHYDQGAPHGTVKPLRAIGKIPATVPLTPRLKHGQAAVNAAPPDRGPVIELGPWGVDYLWAMRDNCWVPIARRRLAEGETPHGKRVDFVDTWADTRERLPDDAYATTLENRELFIALRDFESRLWF